MMADTEVIFMVVITLFVTGLLGLIAIMSMLRQQRNIQVDHGLRLALRPASAGLAPSRIQLLSAYPVTSIPEHSRQPAQGRAASQANFAVETAGNTTRNRRNIQKLIDYLKDDSAASASRKAS